MTKSVMTKPTSILTIAIIILFSVAGTAGCDGGAARAPGQEPGQGASAAQETAPSDAGQVSTMGGYVSLYDPAHIGSLEAWELMASDSRSVMLDVRLEASYLEYHVSGALNVPFEELAGFAEDNLPDKDRLIILYCFCGDKGGSALSAVRLLADLGYTNAYYTEPGEEWSYEGSSANNSAAGSGPAHDSGPRTISGAEAKELRDSYAGAILLDVRNRDEYDERHIEGSRLIPVAELENRLDELPDKDAVIIVYCRAGARSASACEILINNGYTNVRDMQSVDNWPDPLQATRPLS